MTSRRKTPSLKDDDQGVSVVVAAILVFSLIVITMVYVRTQWVPVWEADNEASRSLGAADRMGQLQGQVLMQAGNRTLGEQSVTLSLGDAKNSLFKPVAVPSGLEFRPMLSAVRLEAPEIKVISLNGSLQGGLGNTWVSFPATVSLEDVDRIVDLRLRFEEVSKEKDGRSATVSVTDARGQFAGSYRFRVDVQNPDMHLVRETRDKDNQVVYTTVDSMHTSNTLMPYYDNVLAPDQLFDQVLAAAESPFTLSIAYDPGFDADYNAAYYRGSDTGAPALDSTSGTLRKPYLATHDSGVIVHTLRNQYYPGQTYVVEHGGLVLEQDAGATLLASPPLSLRMVGNQSVVSWDLALLKGEGRLLNGGGTAGVHTVTERTSSMTATAPSLNVTLASTRPDILAAHLTKAFTSSGLDASAGEFNVSIAGNAVTLKIVGRDAGIDHDVTLELRKAEVHVRIKA